MCGCVTYKELNQDMVLLPRSPVRLYPRKFMLSGWIALLLINLGLIGNLAHLKWKLWFMELDALLIIFAIVGGFLILYRHGVGF